ncbi:sigma-70 family RNA polymerase sigma factor [Noviherbaspirillum galbum]|uniref:Sigma-70 family RNA polymerase sigma factor n=1 Tax=Noviherbaspirillum galbum TaxID=2709383 RepID=A0A6B3SJR9_9BURK|nr:sigma-70 family RNA polymerase sigma factor [Noviherbaspirillum galbum]NEX60993.1 sigma-70 family RNA polymerase sigma factor [Noviherbaspirillum galbum]
MACNHPDENNECKGVGVIASESRLRELFLRGLEGEAGPYQLFLKEISAHFRAYLRKRLTGLPDDIEDVLQETLLAVHNQRHTYDPGQPLTAWAYAIARYKMVDLLRRRGGHDALNVPLDDETELFAHSEQEAGEARRDVMKLLDQLPDRQRLPIQHLKLEGLSVSETARLTGMSESAVKVGIHRGLKALAALIRDQ